MPCELQVRVGGCRLLLQCSLAWLDLLTRDLCGQLKFLHPCDSFADRVQHVVSIRLHKPWGMPRRCSSVTKDTAECARGKYQSPASLSHSIAPLLPLQIFFSSCCFACVLWHGSSSGYASSLNAGAITPPGPWGYLSTVHPCVYGRLCGLVVACTDIARLVFCSCLFVCFPHSQQFCFFFFFQHWLQWSKYSALADLLQLLLC